MQPTVENKYASTVEQSRNPSGSAAKACKILVSRIVAIAELRSATPIIGTMPHNMAVAITTAAALAMLPFFICMISVKHSSPYRCRMFTSGVSPKIEDYPSGGFPDTRAADGRATQIWHTHTGSTANDARIGIGV